MKKMRAKRSLQVWVTILFVGCIAFLYTSIDPFGEYIETTISAFILMGAFLYLWGKIIFNTYISVSNGMFIVRAPRVKHEALPVAVTVTNTNYRFDINELVGIRLMVDKSPLSEQKSIWKSYIGKGQTTLLITNNRGETYKINAEGFDNEKLHDFLRNELKGIKVVIE